MLQLLLEILYRTPGWAWAILCALLFLGWRQSRARVVGSVRIMLLPAMLLVLSFVGMGRQFGWQIVAVLTWLLTLAAGYALGVWMGWPRLSRWMAHKQAYEVPGSWVPLGLMLCLYLAQFSAGVVRARHLPVGASVGFILLISTSYGLCSGLFVSRIPSKLGPL